MASLFSVLCRLLTIILKLDSMRYRPELKSEKEHKALFIFGDSLFDPGNNVYINTSREASTYWPYGETFFKHPTGRYSDGRVVPDFIATFAGLPMLPPYLQPGYHRFTDGANFASAGACVLSPDTFDISLRDQLGYFKDVVKSLNQELGNIKAKSVLNNAVYVFSIGGGDYATLVLHNPNITESYKKVFVKMVIGNLTNVLKEVYSLGGRKIAFQSAGPLGCAPHKRIDYDNCDENLSSLARQHNIALSAALEELEKELSGFRYSIFDYYHAVLDRIDNPFKYGFKVGKVACCGVGRLRESDCGEKYGRTFELCSNPLEYVWFDGDHPGEGANHQFAKLIWSGSPNFTWPYNVQQLFAY
ncbi:GDSL esterase/lipase 1 [Cajanus cajan]|uniref:GDSL esterase/lipase 1 n=1 Tax=Cajanus cajan TaxID=3821 RepID=UPI00098DB280|nr:GDSL esterase/lipase 1 [Cajanus cajan]